MLPLPLQVKEVLELFTAIHPDARVATNLIVSQDGVQESKSNKASLDVITCRVPGCGTVFLLSIGRLTPGPYKKEGMPDALANVIKQLNELWVQLEFYPADGVQKSHTMMKVHSSGYRS